MEGDKVQVIPVSDLYRENYDRVFRNRRVVIYDDRLGADGLAPVNGTGHSHYAPDIVVERRGSGRGRG